MSDQNIYDNQFCSNDIMDDYMIISSDDIVQEYEKQQKGKVDLDSFTLLTVVGKGSYAKVVLVRKKDNDKIYAMKILKKAYIQKKKQTTHIKTERQVLAEIIHPSIVKLAYAFQNQEKLFFVLDYCPGGELFNLLSKKKRFTEEQIRFYAGQIVVAVEYLHSKDIVYRDLKPENVLIDKDGYIKLTDFGLSKRLKGNQGAAYSICGTPEYLAPEILERVGHGKPVDWWTLGAIIYEMLTGLPPFYTENRKELFERIKHQQLKYPSYISLELKDLLEKLFEKNQFKRLGSNKGDDIKSHIWFKPLDFQKLMDKKIEPPFIPQLKNEVDVSYFDTCFTETAVYSQREGLIQQPESLQEELYYEDFSYQKSMSCSSKDQTLDQYKQKQNSNDKNYSMVTSIEGGSISDNQFKQANNSQFFLNVQSEKINYNKNNMINNQQQQGQFGGYNNNFYQDNYQLETSIDGISYPNSNGAIIFEQNSQQNNMIMEIEEQNHQNIQK